MSTQPRRGPLPGRTVGYTRRNPREETTRSARTSYVTIYLEPEVRKAFDDVAALLGQSASTAGRQALLLWLEAVRESLESETSTP